MSEVRQRNTTKPKADPPSAAARVKAEDSSFSLLDAARAVCLLLLVSSAVSYFVTRESFVWNIQRPKFTQIEVIKAWINGPQQYTDADLAAYDGTDPDKPILLAINGTIYDVTKGRRHYGPGGSYHFFAGADSSRAFVTSCFAEDRTPDLRGVELMFIPQDDPEVDSLYTKGQLKALKEQERRKAREQVHAALKHWVDFFEGSRKYTKVGRVKRAKGWETKGEVRELCQRAQEGRPKSRAPPPKA